MKTLILQPAFRAAGLFCAFAFASLLTGCGGLAYNDPNVPASQRYFNTMGSQPIVLAQAQPRSPVEAQSISPVGTQPGSPSGAQPTPTGGVPRGSGQSVSNVLTAAGSQSSSKLGIGDLLTVNFSDMPQGSMPVEQEHRVGDDGLITLPMNVEVQAAGKTPTQLQKEIRDAYVPQWFVHLTVVVKARDRYVFVDGEVKVPSKMFHLDGLTALRAISTAGGFTDFANRGKIEVRRAIGGKTELVDWNKARKNPKLDLPLYVNDTIYVHRRVW